MNHLVFDLDGTLVDHRGRTYGLHRDYCLAHGYTPVPVETYHARKGMGESERLTVRESIPAAELDSYMAWKRSQIESDEALALDRAWPEMLTLLGRLAPRATLVLLTCRQSEGQARKQLQRLAMADKFTTIIATPSDDSTNSKVGALRAYLERAAIDPALVTVIGDTECEIAAARAVGASCFSVTWGVRSADFLGPRRPDGLVFSAAELEDMITARLDPSA